MEDESNRRDRLKDMIPGLVHIAEMIKGRLYLATVRPSISATLKSKSNSLINYFSIDNDLIYEGFDSDFGPLNAAMLYRYCVKLNKLLKPNKKKIVHFTSTDSKKRANAAYLIGSYCIIYLKSSPEDVYNKLLDNNGPHFLPFRDAAFGQCTFHLYLLDCFKAVKKVIFI
jgi:cell division cycle 14